MLKKRLVGVITVKNGWAVQSFGYRRYLPLGRPEVLAENLDRWGVDEILLQCVDRTIQHPDPDFELLQRVASKGLGTPLIYGGGIRSVEHGGRAVKLGADRIVIDALVQDDLKTVESLSRHLGAQAIIAALPLTLVDGRLDRQDYRTSSAHPLDGAVLDAIERKVVSEVLIIDWYHEGISGGFEPALVEAFPVKSASIITFGGISEAEQMRRLLQMPQVVAVAIGNFLNYRENAVSAFRRKAAGLPLRAPAFATPSSAPSS